MHKIIFILSFIYLSFLSLKAELPDTVWIKDYSEFALVQGIKFSPDEQFIICSLSNGFIHVLNVKDGSLFKEYKFPKNVGGGFDFTPDSQYIAVGSGQTLTIMNWKSGEIKSEFPFIADNFLFTGAGGKYIATYKQYDSMFYNPKTHLQNDARTKATVNIYEFNSGSPQNPIGKLVKQFKTEYIFVDGAGSIYYKQIKSTNDGKNLTLIQVEGNNVSPGKYTLYIYNIETWESTTFDGYDKVLDFSIDNNKVYIDGSVFRFPSLQKLKFYDFEGYGCLHNPNGEYEIDLVSAGTNTNIYVLDSAYKSILYKYRMNYLYNDDKINYIAITNTLIAAGGGVIALLNLKTFITFIDNDLPNTMNDIIYPNPTTDYLNIKLNPNQDNSEIEIFNFLGEKILSQITTSSSIKVNISQFSPGVYFIKIGDKVTKFVKY